MPAKAERKQIKPGDTVETPDGEALVRSIDQRVDWVFGKPEKSAWLVVEYPRERGHYRWLAPASCSFVR